MVFSLTIVACTSSTNNQVTTAETETPDLAMPVTDWVNDRVNEAQQRLSQSEGGQMVWKATEAHGGLAKWYSNGPVYFRFNYRPLGKGTIRDTYQTVDTWRAKARHQLAANPDEEYGWDGAKAWKYPENAEIGGNNPRFWSMTPYYFVGMPFVFADEGIILTREEDREYNGKQYHLVRATFQDVGDAPDDFYVLYLNAQTFKLEAIRYIVSYPGYFPEGGHTQEKLMTYEGSQTIEGITLAENHRTYMWENDDVGEHVTNISTTDVSFRPETLNSYFDVPEGSYVMSGFMDK